MAARADAEPLARRALRAVGRDDVARAHRALAAAVAVAQLHGHAVVVLLELDGLARILEPRAGASACWRRMGSRPICVMNSRGAGLRSSTPSLIERKYQSSSLPPSDSTDDDRAVLDELGGGRGLDLAAGCRARG